MPAIAGSKEIIAEIRGALGVGRFEFIDLPTAEVLFYNTRDGNGWLCVIGHEQCAAYEWIIKEGDCRRRSSIGSPVVSRYRFSNKGYGDFIIALGDGIHAVNQKGEQDA